MQPEITERTCAKCKHWQPGKTAAEYRELRLVNCRLLPRWEFLPAHSTCEKHEAAGEKAVAARAAWLTQE
jgi:hypothetical protein